MQVKRGFHYWRQHFSCSALQNSFSRTQTPNVSDALSAGNMSQKQPSASRFEVRA